MNQHQSDIYYGIIPDPGEYDGDEYDEEEEETITATWDWGFDTSHIVFFDEQGQIIKPTTWDEGEVTPC
jgi:hypothetical protein